MDDYTFSDSDWDELDQGSAVQSDDLSYNPDAESSAWSGDTGGYDYSMPENNWQSMEAQQPLDFSSLNQYQQSYAPGSFQQQFAPEQYGMSQAPAQLPDMGDTGGGMGGISNVLSQLFSGQQGKGVLSGLGALIEGMQNKKKASSVQNIVNQQQQRTDPFGSQRPFYQQQLQSTVQNPYSQPMVKDQVAQIARAQAIKDAAAGRRSNSATSSPAMLAAQAQIAQQYMNSLMQPAGANISPNASGLQELLQGNQAGINGYASPIMSALGYNQQINSNQAQLDAIKQLLAGSR